MSRQLKPHDNKNGDTLAYHHRPVIVAFGDIIGFTHWTKSPLYSQSKFKHKILTLSKHFVNFQASNPFFVKRMGDGIMAVVELDENKLLNQKKAICLMTKIKRLNGQITETIEKMDFPRPVGFRSRLVAGDALRLKSTIRGKTEIDYIGYPINLAFNLLGVRPDIPFMAHETVKSIVDARPHQLKSISIFIETTDYKGVDREDLAVLWNFELIS